MSGVGVSGLLANLPGTVTPYPTQDPALELGGYRSVANAAARDAIPANFRTVGMVATLQDTGVSYELFGGLTNASWRVYVGAAFRGFYFVDPTFTGIQLGSQSNPFSTVAAAFAFAAALGVANGVVNLLGNTVENVTFPTTGEWDLCGMLTPGYSGAVTITGNLDISASAAARRYVSDVLVTGNLTGNTSAGVHRVTFERVNVSGTTTLTISGSGTVRLGTLGGVPGVNLGTSNMFYCFFAGAVAVQGTIWGSCASFQSTVSVSGRCSFFNCVFVGTITTTAHVADDNQLIFNDCLVPVAINISQSVGGRLALVSGSNTSFDTATITFSGIGIPVFGCDQRTAQSFSAHGGAIVGLPVSAPPFTMSTLRATAQTNNIASTRICFKGPIPQMRMNATLTLQTPGTAGAAVLNAIYTDSLGVSRTKAVTPALNIAGAAGDEVQGSLLFTQDGSTQFNFSVTGIVTPGALAYGYCVSLEPGC